MAWRGKILIRKGCSLSKTSFSEDWISIKISLVLYFESPKSTLEIINMYHQRHYQWRVNFKSKVFKISSSNIFLVSQKTKNNCWSSLEAFRVPFWNFSAVGAIKIIRKMDVSQIKITFRYKDYGQRCLTLKFGFKNST